MLIRVRDGILRFGLCIGLIVTALYYLMELSHTSQVDLFYILNEPLLQKNLVYDIVSFLVMLYWAYLVIFFRRVKRPYFPFLVFMLHVAVEPYLVMGDNAVFLRYRRLIPFRLGYPIALGACSIWLVTWVIEKKIIDMQHFRRLNNLAGKFLRKGGSLFPSKVRFD